MSSYLDKNGLSYFWAKVKSFVTSQINSKLPYAAQVTLYGSGWQDNKQTVSVSGVIADETKQMLQPVPSNSDLMKFKNSGIFILSSSEGSVTFSCDEVPDSDLTIYVVMTELRSS